MTNPVLVNVQESPAFSPPGAWALAHISPGSKVRLHHAVLSLPFWVQVSRIVRRGPFDPSLLQHPPRVMAGFIISGEARPELGLKPDEEIVFAADNVAELA